MSFINHRKIFFNLMRQQVLFVILGLLPLAASSDCFSKAYEIAGIDIEKDKVEITPLAKTNVEEVPFLIETFPQWKTGIIICSKDRQLLLCVESDFTSLMEKNLKEDGLTLHPREHTCSGRARQETSGSTISPSRP